MPGPGTRWGLERIVISTGQEMHSAHRLYRRLGSGRFPERG